ncbi:unnamed protein product, partial [Prorocentrum cordatum]
RRCCLPGRGRPQPQARRSLQADLRETFQRWGALQSVQVNREGAREVGVVTFAEAIDASDAQRQLHGQICNFEGAAGALAVVAGAPELLSPPVPRPAPTPVPAPALPAPVMQSHPAAMQSHPAAMQSHPAAPPPDITWQRLPALPNPPKSAQKAKTMQRGVDYDLDDIWECALPVSHNLLEYISFSVGDILCGGDLSLVTLDSAPVVVRCAPWSTLCDGSDRPVHVCGVSAGGSFVRGTDGAVLPRATAPFSAPTYLASARQSKLAWRAMASDARARLKLLQADRRARCEQRRFRAGQSDDSSSDEGWLDAEVAADFDEAVQCGQAGINYNDGFVLTYGRRERRREKALMSQWRSITGSNWADMEDAQEAVLDALGAVLPECGSLLARLYAKPAVGLWPDGEGDLREFSAGAGVPQGCPLSPAAYAAALHRATLLHFTGSPRWLVTACLDDVVAVVPAAEAQQLLQDLSGRMNAWGLTLNETKTKVWPPPGHAQCPPALRPYVVDELRVLGCGLTRRQDDDWEELAAGSGGGARAMSKVAEALRVVGQTLQDALAAGLGLQEAGAMLRWTARGLPNHPLRAQLVDLQAVQNFDHALRGIWGWLLDEPLTDREWAQACLPLRVGGLAAGAAEPRREAARVAAWCAAAPKVALALGMGSAEELLARQAAGAGDFASAVAACSAKVGNAAHYLQVSLAQGERGRQKDLMRPIMVVLQGNATAGLDNRALGRIHSCGGPGAGAFTLLPTAPERRMAGDLYRLSLRRRLQMEGARLLKTGPARAGRRDSVRDLLARWLAERVAGPVRTEQTVPQWLRRRRDPATGQERVELAVLDVKWCEKGTWHVVGTGGRLGEAARQLVLDRLGRRDGEAGASADAAAFWQELSAALQTGVAEQILAAHRPAAENRDLQNLFTAREEKRERKAMAKWMRSSIAKGVRNCVSDLFGFKPDSKTADDFECVSDSDDDGSSKLRTILMQAKSVNKNQDADLMKQLLERIQPNKPKQPDPTADLLANLQAVRDTGMSSGPAPSRPTPQEDNAALLRGLLVQMQHAPVTPSKRPDVPFSAPEPAEEIEEDEVTLNACIEVARKILPDTDTDDWPKDGDAFISRIASAAGILRANSLSETTGTNKTAKVMQLVDHVIRGKSIQMPPTQ